MMTCNIELFKQAVAFTLTLRKFNNRRKGDTSHIETDTKKDRLRVSKKLLESPELDAIAEFQANLYQWCINRSVPTFFKDGIYLVKTTEIESFEAKLNAAKVEQVELITALQAKYAEQIEQAKVDLNGMFRALDYPRVEDLPGRFGIEWNWIAFGVPENLPAELRAAEAAKIETQFKEAETQIMAALRDGFAEIISHVTDRLTVKSGEKKIFRNTLFYDLTEFIATFNARNIVNDKELGDMVTRARGILETVHGKDAGQKTETVRDSSQLRNMTARAFADLKQSVDDSVITRPRRKFELDLE